MLIIERAVCLTVVMVLSSASLAAAQTTPTSEPTPWKPEPAAVFRVQEVLSGEITQGPEYVVAQDVPVRSYKYLFTICRALFNIQQYGHGGGLLIVPRCPAAEVNVKYEQTYNRMPIALFRLAQHQILKRQTTDTIAAHCQTPSDMLPCAIHFDAIQYQQELDRLKNELIGCVRYMAPLSRVDGFVLFDRSLVVHGFGVETRAGADLTDVYVVGDAKASQRLLRQVSISQFGTRHRAMMRYCNGHDRAGLRDLARRRHPCHDEVSRPARAMGEHQRSTCLSS